MNEIYERLRNLKGEISEVYGYHTNQITYVIKLLEHGLETITYVKNHPEVRKEELEIAVCFGESIISIGRSRSWEKNNKKLKNKLYQLVEQMEKEIESMREMDQMNQINITTYTDLNEWIESLDIGKFRNQHIGVDQYRTSYEVYVDLRKAIMNKTTWKQEIYTGKIVEQLDDGRERLSESCKIEVEDYELAQLIKMIRDNPRFNYRLQRRNCNSCNLEMINESIEREILLSKRGILEKRLEILARNSRNH